MSPTSCQTAPPRISQANMVSVAAGSRKANHELVAFEADSRGLRVPANTRGKTRKSRPLRRFRGPRPTASARERARSPVEQRSPHDAEHEQRKAIHRERPTEREIGRQRERRIVG